MTWYVTWNGVTLSHYQSQVNMIAWHHLIYISDAKVERQIPIFMISINIAEKFTSNWSSPVLEATLWSNNPRLSQATWHLVFLRSYPPTCPSARGYPLTFPWAREYIPQHVPQLGGRYVSTCSSGSGTPKGTNSQTNFGITLLHLQMGRH